MTILATSSLKIILLFAFPSFLSPLPFFEPILNAILAYSVGEFRHTPDIEKWTILVVGAVLEPLRTIKGFRFILTSYKNTTDTTQTHYHFITSYKLM